MKLLGFEITRSKALAPVPAQRHGLRIINEPWSGAWQSNASETRGDLVTYPALYACVSRVASDIAKLPFNLKRRTGAGIWETTTNPAYSPVLRKPNGYQTAQQFREAWVLSSLLHGNTYALKRRDARGVVDALYVLDPCRVMPLVADSGDVFYQLNFASANNLLPENYPATQITVPASEVIHDREVTPHHQLVGVPPIAAAYWPTVKNMRILRSSAEFFGNRAQPGGILTAPAGMSDEDAEEVRTYWQTNFTGQNAGRVAVVGADMKFISFAQTSVDSQLIEQLRFGDEQIAMAFGVPAFLLGLGGIPSGLKADDLQLLYLNNALSARIERMENCLDDGLGLGENMGVELDLAPLLRMDAERQANVAVALVKGGIATPNEGRKRFNLPPLYGGDSVFLQQQNYSLEALAKRDASADPFGNGGQA